MHPARPHILRELAELVQESERCQFILMLSRRAQIVVLDRLYFDGPWGRNAYFQTWVGSSHVN
eukprot:scaffold535198_cov27-Prasinocladus_malaysianus.AAC.1